MSAYDYTHEFPDHEEEQTTPATRDQIVHLLNRQAEWRRRHGRDDLADELSYILGRITAQEQLNRPLVDAE